MSLRAPRFFFRGGVPSSLVGGVGGDIAPQLRMMPNEISGKGMCSCGQICSVSCHIILLPPALHSTRMCSRDSTFWHGTHIWRCSHFGTLLQKPPTFGVWCIILNRNCLILVQITGFRVLFQIDASVSSSPVYSCRALLANFKLVAVDAKYGVFCLSCIPRYALLWVSVANFAPCRLNLIGIERSRISGSFFSAPCFAS